MVQEIQELRELVLRELYGGLWHITHPERFKSILISGAILPEPNLSEREREKTSNGPDGFPYVRSLNGVSLFDFEHFDSNSYSKKCPSSSWAAYVPFRTLWDSSVWIEIDRKLVANQIISGTNLLAQWKSDKAYIHTIMPYIEVAHLGPLPQIAFKRAFLVCRGDNELHPVACK